MKINNSPRLAAILRLFQSGSCPLLGGQAVLEGVMMRNDNIYSVAVRQENGAIVVQREIWKRLVTNSCLRLPFIRGFPFLLESLINGIHALNLSARLLGEEDDSSLPAFWSLILALIVALSLFVVAPHLLSALMFALNLGGDLEGVSFHLWDGFYKCLIFVAYIRLMALVPDLRRVFEYHGAEHKTIHAWEDAEEVNCATTHRMSRLHPRCGTTFLLFVICVSIIAQALLLPLLLSLWTPPGAIARHALSLLWKLALIVPISAIAYELLRFAARLPEGFPGNLLRAPGLALQRLTTSEPDKGQLEVAIVALAAALGSEACDLVQTPPYSEVPADAEWKKNVC